MKKFALATAALIGATSAATAGGIDRSGQFLGPLWEEGGETGTYFQLGFGNISPAANNDAGSDPLGSYDAVNLAAKLQLSDQLSFALIVDEPFGAKVAYTDGPFNRGSANIDSRAVTGILRYEMAGGFSFHGGLRAQQIQGAISSTVGGAPRLLRASSDMDFGVLAGVAYERPEIALRVALTYNSEIDQALTGSEITFTPAPSPAATAFTVTTPASWNLEFQSGIAQDTLVFGSVRYAEWDGFNLTTPGAGQYVNFNGNTTTYSLGVGRRFNDNWSGAVTLGYEAAGDRPGTTPLAPTTGSRSIGLGVTYTEGRTKVTAGVTYAKLGNQSVGTVNFNDNKAIGAGIRLGFNF